MLGVVIDIVARISYLVTNYPTTLLPFLFRSLQSSARRREGNVPHLTGSNLVLPATTYCRYKIVTRYF